MTLHHGKGERSTAAAASRRDRRARLKGVLSDHAIVDAPEFARRCGLKESTARAYFNGTRTPSRKKCEQIGRSLDVSGAWLYTGEGPKQGMQEPTAKLELVFPAVEEAFLRAGINPEAAAEIASAVALHVGNLMVPQGMTAEQAIRRL